MHKFRKYDRSHCPCGNIAVGRLNNCAVCERCAAIELKLSKWASGENIERRATGAVEEVTIAQFKERFAEWCERNGVNWKQERDDWRGFDHGSNSEVSGV